MKYKKFNFFGLNTSCLGLLNRILLQWAFVRLQAQVEDNMDISEVHLIGFIIPLTGWSMSNQYRYVGKDFQKTLWKSVK